MKRRATDAALMPGLLASRPAAAGRVRRPAITLRQRLGRYLPVALLALLLQVLAPVAASALTAAAIASFDPFGGAVICHAETDAAPSNRDADRTACGLDCVMCCVLHAAAALDASPAPAHAAPQLRMQRIDWTARELRLVHLLAWSQAQPRGPPFFS
ncbi:hypothetical protein LQG66_06880 [Bradyrhizobium ontarionense]|uniref:DUF2946 domain-containing protein n=1 Tax=Bradyrhizobium ontarionense TaxID=2898149 RepID=A0ABY3RGA2_9BRAD|nr:DUF2946 family protein [Bradyrhizobium sp. A19]UFZ06027.1 hypothetical protein LQG66_06880 [Bradyrhizobium sp. A19]